MHFLPSFLKMNQTEIADKSIASAKPSEVNPKNKVSVIAGADIKIIPERQAVFIFWIFKISTTITAVKAMKNIVNIPVIQGKSYHVLKEQATDRNHLPEAIAFCEE